VLYLVRVCGVLVLYDITGDTKERGEEQRERCAITKSYAMSEKV
jgi:hypothetical protein